MSQVTATGEKKPCALETAANPTPCADEPQGARPCALLCAQAPPSPPPAAPPEDESADPVGDGHSDADWARRHPRDR